MARSSELKRTTAQSAVNQGRKLYGRVHDVLLFFVEELNVELQ